MKITAIELQNIRGFQSLPKTELSKSINVFIGANNSGKSTILSCIYMLQNSVLTKTDFTIGQVNSKIVLFFDGTHSGFCYDNNLYDKVSFDLNTHIVLGSTKSDIKSNISLIKESEPNNLIYPFLSKRKTVQFSDSINETNTNSVSGNFVNLYSKIDRLITPQYYANGQYISACANILGFQISTKAKGNGKQGVYYVHKEQHIPLTAMGEGVVNIIGLITDLCVAEERIFLIEEPENDIHPKALKELMKLIIEKSSTNQFFISTHSNIVLKYLGGVPDAKVFHIKNDKRDIYKPNLFISTMKEIPNEPEERRNVLEDLGYDFFDFDFWKAWLFLEESSAEVIIRDYLIDWFIPTLRGKIRTFSANGTSNLVPKFEDFNRLFVFMHLEPTYKNRVWVLIDSGEDERNIIEKMKEKYTPSGWDESNFGQLSEHNFEKYYPSIFQEKVEKIISISDKKQKRDAKKLLLEEVKAWIDSDRKLAKEEFKESAKEVIDYLKGINKQLVN